MSRVTLPSLSLDHLLIGAPDLDRGCDFVERRLGTRPLPGGVHPGQGTRNALIGLSNECYLEVLAPDPAQASTPSSMQSSTPWPAPMSRFLAGLPTPSLMWWAARCPNVETLRTGLLAQGMDVSPVLHGSRKTADGTEFRWRWLLLRDAELGAALPFFIEWGDEDLHPARTLPVGGDLLSFRIRHPAATRLRPVLGRAFDVGPAEAARISVQIDAAKGVCSLHTPDELPPGVGELVAGQAAD